jgi:succinate-semialdehyde dehydrogenase/glutarate-semialdehyde dehydrogenase
MKLGDGLDSSVQMGPVINGGRRNELEGVIADAVKAGARVVAGGARPPSFNAGFFLEPTVLADVIDDMKVFAEENFGPIAAITRFDNEDEVLSRANNGEMGLAAYAFTRSPDRARRSIAALEAGMVGINSFALAASEAPFGGTRYSGMGREGGAEGIADYLETKLAHVVF